jgi:hypothetical protein
VASKYQLEPFLLLLWLANISQNPLLLWLANISRNPFLWLANISLNPFL